MTREGGAGTREFARTRSVRFERVATRPRETPRRAHLLRGEGDQPRDPHVRLRNAAHLQVVVRQRVRYRRRELVQGFHERRDLFLGASEGPLQERDPGRGVLRRGAREGPSGRCEHGGGLRARGRGLFWVHRACPGTEGHHPPEGGKPTHRSGCLSYIRTVHVHVHVHCTCTRTCSRSRIAGEFYSYEYVYMYSTCTCVRVQRGTCTVGLRIDKLFYDMIYVYNVHVQRCTPTRTVNNLPCTEVSNTSGNRITTYLRTVQHKRGVQLYTT